MAVALYRLRCLVLPTRCFLLPALVQLRAGQAAGGSSSARAAVLNLARLEQGFGSPLWVFGGRPKPFCTSLGSPLGGGLHWPDVPGLKADHSLRLPGLFLPFKGQLEVTRGVSVQCPPPLCAGVAAQCSKPAFALLGSLCKVSTALGSPPRWKEPAQGKQEGRHAVWGCSRWRIEE